MALLVDWSYPTPEIYGSNPVMGKFVKTVNCNEKTKIRKKEAGNGVCKKSIYCIGKHCKWFSNNPKSQAIEAGGSR